MVLTYILSIMEGVDVSSAPISIANAHKLCWLNHLISLHKSYQHSFPLTETPGLCTKLTSIATFWAETSLALMLLAPLSQLSGHPVWPHTCAHQRPVPLLMRCSKNPHLVPKGHLINAWEKFITLTHYPSTSLTLEIGGVYSCSGEQLKFDCR